MNLSLLNDLADKVAEDEAVFLEVSLVGQDEMPSIPFAEELAVRVTKPVDQSMEAFT